MAKAIRISKPTFREWFAKFRQQLKRGILTLPTENKIPLKPKPLWEFLKGEFAGTTSLFDNWNVAFVPITIKFIALIFCGILTAMVVILFAGNDNIPMIVRYILPIVCITLPFVTLYDIDLNLNNKDRSSFWANLKKTRPMFFKSLSLGCVVFVVILFAWLSTLFNWGHVLMPIAMGLVFLWIVTEIVYMVKNWPNKK